MMKTTRLIHALWVAALAIGFAGCASDNEPTSAAGKDADSPKELTFTAGTPDDGSTQTRVAYEDTERKLTWEAGDKLLMAGFDAGSYIESKDYTYIGAPGETSGDFTGTPVAGATTYTAYYPSTVQLDVDGANPTLSMDGQTQSANDNTDHLKNYMLLQAEDIPSGGSFSLKMKSSIMKFDLKNIPVDVGELRSLIWGVSSASGNKSLKLNFSEAAVVINGSENTLTAYLGFMPADMKVPTDGKFTVVLIGEKTYQRQIEVPDGMTYEEGKRYTATINDGWKLMDQMTFTTSVTAGQNYTPFFSITESAPADMVIDWGTNEKPSFVSSGRTINRHEYQFGGDYAITIYSTQIDATQKQIPKLAFSGTGLLKVETPLLNMDVTDLGSLFYECDKLTSLSNGLFDKNTKVTNFSRCFRGCAALTSLPNGLFDKNTEATNFSECFKNCTKLANLPAGLFDKNTKAENFEDCFEDCEALTSLPDGLFDKNTEATSFNGCFAGCQSLQELPEGLFAKNLEATDFTYCFSGCTSLKLNKYIFGFTETDGNKQEDKDRFKGKAMIFKSCFQRVGQDLGKGNAGEAPTLWEYERGTEAWTTDYCFISATNLSNYNEIHADWK